MLSIGLLLIWIPCGSNWFFACEAPGGVFGALQAGLFWFDWLTPWRFLVCLPTALALLDLVACAALVCVFMVLAFPCFLIGVLASPLCGAGTYFSLPAAKKSRQKKAAHTASS
ncbi:hypothetical protein PQQ63_25045 [Paraburkholderia metrosideri]|uniref:Uncharacterized protein n=1 Tax=Paraburkholderia metrosideri TaxID=580937 RepID=A0ABW9DZK9_9BURK